MGELIAPRCSSTRLRIVGVAAARNSRKPPHVRAWQCQQCGARLDRDINAAVNVAKAAGWR